MRSALVQRAARARARSLSVIVPPRSSQDYSPEYASIAAAILYQSPLPTQSGLPLYILNAAAFPDAHEVDFDSLLPYVLARLPDEDALLAGTEYEVVFFAGGQAETATGDMKSGPSVGWYIRVYQVLSRALRKRLQRIWIVHEKSWVRVLTEVFSTIVSPKFKKKVIHVGSLSGLALHIPIERLLIPPAVYLHDRRVSQDIYAPYSTGVRAFEAETPFPTLADGSTRMPRVLRETTAFILNEKNMRMEGIFRIPPHSVTLGVLEEAYNRGQRFIIWKEGGASLAEPATPSQVMAEVHEADAYGVHLAAGLIKVWYRKLRIPIFPQNSYDFLRQQFGDPDKPVSREALSMLLSPSSVESMLPAISRTIITKHLLPLLSIVASYQKSNRMTAENLAVCFAPAMINGPDQLQDAKMTTIIRRFMTDAIVQWTDGLEQACGANEGEFFDSLKPPAVASEYEDPLPAASRKPSESSGSGRIRMHDNDGDEDAPALPPRTSSLEHGRSPERRIPPPMPKRKPAPAVATLPRYSTLIHSSPSSSHPPAYTNGSSVDEKARVADAQNGFLTEKSASAASTPVDRRSVALSTLTISDRDMTRSPSPTTAAAPLASPMLTPSLAEIQGAQLRSVSGESARSVGSANDDDSLFVKPTWAASSRKASASSITSTHRKPTPPLKVLKNNSGTGERVDSGAHSGATVPAYLPKPRAPSPGLLQRMQSWEKEAGESAAVNPMAADRGRSTVSPRKQSVDDLKRVYEDRANTVASLAPVVRSRSTASVRSVS